MNKKLQLVLIILAIIFNFKNVNSQCAPENCLSLLPSYGGICDSSLVDGRINEVYYDKISFHITNACIDLGTLDPQYSGIGAKMLKLHTFSFTGLPAGLTGATNQVEYNAPSNGCAAITGTPTTVGTFKVTIHFLANIRTWPLSSTCGGLFPVTVDENDQPFDGDLDLVILPDPSFTGLDTAYCTNDLPVTLTPTGTSGGDFIGPGVNGNIFNPSLAGPGVHEIKYIVSAQEGNAVGPATDSAVFTVTVIGYIFTVNAYICTGDTYLWRGQSYAVNGTYYDSLLTIQNCDSIFVLNLNVSDGFTFIDSVFFCQGDTFQWNGNAYYTAGTYYDSLLTVSGCDSILILYLAVNPTFIFTDNEEICEGDTFLWRGNDYTVAGLYYDSLVTINNCDSVYILNLIVNDTYNIVLYDSVCMGQNYNWHGYQFDTAGTYYDSLSTVAGCDSIFTLHLYVWPSYAFSDNEYICQGDSLLWRGLFYNVTGTYYDSLFTINGCDSVFVLNLLVHPHYEVVENIPVCQGSFYTWRGNDYDVAGTYYDSLQTVFACDSVFVLNLSVVTSYPVIEKADICVDDVYFWRGNSYSITGIYYDTVVGTGVCDTIYQLNLGVHNSYIDSVFETICEGDVYTWRGGDYSIAGLYYDSLLTLYGCDSLYILNLNVDSVELSVSQNGAILTSEAQNALYQWVDCDNDFAEIPGENTAVFTATQNGNFAVIVSQNNCADTSLCYNVTGFYTSHTDILNQIKLYPNPNYGVFYIEIYEESNLLVINTLGNTVYTEKFVNGRHELNLTHLPAGVYLIIAENNLNLKSLRLLILNN